VGFYAVDEIGARATRREGVFVCTLPASGRQHSLPVALCLRLGIVAQRTSRVTFALGAPNWTCAASECGSTRVCAGVLPCHMLRRIHDIYDMTALLHGCAIHQCWNLHPGTLLNEHQ
jgi:hypothetical protein